MTKYITAEQCIAVIHADSAWRKKEISSIGNVIAAADDSEKPYLIRCGLVMLYAHWEGFVKHAASTYILHINERVSRFGASLNEHFTSLLIWRSIQDRGDYPHTKNPCGFLDAMENWKATPAKLLSDKMIDTESNLTSSVFRKIVKTIDISVEDFSARFNMIDEKILGHRNKIAHGQRLQFQIKDYEETDREVRELLALFQSKIEDCVQAGVFIAK